MSTNTVPATPGRTEFTCDYCGREERADNLPRWWNTITVPREDHHGAAWGEDSIHICKACTAEIWSELRNRQLVGVAGKLDDVPQDVRFFREGNQWACVGEDFINLQESVAGFGEAPRAALISYQAAKLSAELAKPDNGLGGLATARKT